MGGRRRPIGTGPGNHESRRWTGGSVGVIAGRRPADLSVSVFAFKPPTPDAVRRLEDLGVTRVTLVAPRRLDDALPFLDRMAALAG